MVQQEIDFQIEFKRRHTQEQDMLRAFKEKGVLTTADLLRIGTGCSSRLKSLRRKGHVIAAKYERPGLYSYTYLGFQEPGDAE